MHWSGTGKWYSAGLLIREPRRRLGLGTSRTGSPGDRCVGRHRQSDRGRACRRRRSSHRKREEQADRLDETAAALGACGSIVADVSTEHGVARLVSEIANRFGRLDALICNVGSGRSRPGLQEDLGDWDRMIRTNLLSATLMVREATPLLADRDSAIVCISSICGLEALGCPLAYSAAKAALNAYVHCASRPLAQQGVRINAVAPGNIVFPGSVWEQQARGRAVRRRRHAPP